jgi:hypothetical protein
MAEEVNNNTGNQEPKTFTQDEVNAMIGERLTRERQKYADYDTLKEKAGKYDEAQEANKTELQKALDNAAKAQKELDALKSANTVRDIRDKVAKEMEIPASLLTADTEEACKAQAEAIIAYAGGTKKKYPAPKENNISHKESAQDATMRDWAKSLFAKG